MRLFFAVIAYNEADHCFILQEKETGEIHHVMMEIGTNKPKDLIGKRISTSHLRPIIEMAIDPKIEI